MQKLLFAILGSLLLLSSCHRKSSSKSKPPPPPDFTIELEAAQAMPFQPLKLVVTSMPPGQSFFYQVEFSDMSGNTLVFSTLPVFQAGDPIWIAAPPGVLDLASTIAPGEVSVKLIGDFGGVKLASNAAKLAILPGTAFALPDGVVTKAVLNGILEAGLFRMGDAGIMNAQAQAFGHLGVESALIALAREADQLSGLAELVKSVSSGGSVQLGSLAGVSPVFNWAGVKVTDRILADWIAALADAGGYALPEPVEYGAFLTGLLGDSATAREKYLFIARGAAELSLRLTEQAHLAGMNPAGLADVQVGALAANGVIMTGAASAFFSGMLARQATLGEQTFWDAWSKTVPSVFQAYNAAWGHFSFYGFYAPLYGSAFGKAGASFFDGIFGTFDFGSKLGSGFATGLLPKNGAPLSGFMFTDLAVSQTGNGFHATGATSPAMKKILLRLQTVSAGGTILFMDEMTNGAGKFLFKPVPSAPPGAGIVFHALDPAGNAHAGVFSKAQ